MSVLRHSIAGHVYGGMRQIFKASLSTRILKAHSIQSSSTLFSTAHSRPKSFQQATGFFHSSSIIYNKCSDTAAPADQFSKDEQTSSTSGAAKATNAVVEQTAMLTDPSLTDAEKLANLTTVLEDQPFFNTDFLKYKAQAEEHISSLEEENVKLKSLVDFFKSITMNKPATDVWRSHAICGGTFFSSKELSGKPIFELSLSECQRDLLKCSSQLKVCESELSSANWLISDLKAKNEKLDSGVRFYRSMAKDKLSDDIAEATCAESPTRINEIKNKHTHDLATMKNTYRLVEEISKLQEDKDGIYKALEESEYEVRRVEEDRQSLLECYY